MIAEAVAALLLLVGAAFILIGSIGLARLPDFFTRLHSPTKATTLGLGSIAAAGIIVSGGDLRGLVILLFVFITAPITAHVLGKVAKSRSLNREGRR
ncbi:monovalent cation/H+ antiporter subunit G [Polymorphobacter glacialis]|uniref:Monovalent cation/H+ antiporter subunit G n=1 Tax=Sandarakinorhabdus glacialis TaxID=1614636 RepID=A0A916ZK48_9SPHN|nr:monovalent cation/H(+) antiporter subunit G [Polymorphobacter glacialis]GGE00480.1 monovalent cation/H+ antiporter subunit G [Polymorphobacter glacialis]